MTVGRIVMYLTQAVGLVVAIYAVILVVQTMRGMFDIRWHDGDPVDVYWLERIADRIEREERP